MHMRFVWMLLDSSAVQLQHKTVLLLYESTPLLDQPCTCNDLTPLHHSADRQSMCAVVDHLHTENVLPILIEI